MAITLWNFLIFPLGETLRPFLPPPAWRYPLAHCLGPWQLQGPHRGRILQCLSLGLWLLSPSMPSLGSVPVVAGGCASLLVKVQGVPRGGWATPWRVSLLPPGNT